METKKAVKENKNTRSCPYLDTVKRQVLDFDSEKECSVCLSHKNVYICLVCGLYLQGRGESTYAYSHSVQMDHHVFMNIETQRFYCLPDNYEVIDDTLNDIKLALDPVFTKEYIQRIDTITTLSTDQMGTSYIPGVLGMTAVDSSDYINCILHAFSQVKILRDFFLLPENYQTCTSPLVHSFGSLIRKIWSPYRFRAKISPQEFLNELVRTSNSKYTVTKRQDSIQFLTWFVNYMHSQLKDKKDKSIVSECFRGKIQIEETTYTERDTKRVKKEDLPIGPEEGEQSERKEQVKEDMFDHTSTVKTIPCFFLSLDLPPIPVFKDDFNANTVQHMPLYTLLEKFGGEHITVDSKTGVERKIKIISLPKYLILVINRFIVNNFFLEKNNSVVQFPIKNLEMRDCVMPIVSPYPPVEELNTLSINKLQKLLKSLKVDSNNIIEKEELISKSKEAINNYNSIHNNTKYNLIATVCHELSVNEEQNKKRNIIESGFYKCFIRNKISTQWYEIQDALVREADTVLISVSDAIILVYARTDSE
ncbi:hypothetical protein WA158_008403 [Blastocystis sp. Blastoise]